MAIIFPVLPGRGWSVTKTPNFESRIKRADSGRELRASDFGNPLWKFNLVHEFLRGPAIGGATGYVEAGILQGVYTSCRGTWAPFFFDDPQDDQALGQALGTGDSLTTQFQLQRYFGDPTFVTLGFTEAITAPKGGAAVIYFNGVVQPTSGYSVSPQTGVVSFLAAPPSGVAITADFNFWFRCRFSAGFSLEEFMQLWHGVKTLDFQSALGDQTPAP